MSKRVEGREPVRKYTRMFKREKPPHRWYLVRDFTSDGFRNTVER